MEIIKPWVERRNLDDEKAPVAEVVRYRELTSVLKRSLIRRPRPQATWP
jgi:hypothetical protein